MTHYSDPVSHLLHLNEPNAQKWLNYLETFGFNAGHIPELIDMLHDPDLQNAEPDTAEVWAPLHAWRALGQLKAEQAVPTLLAILEAFPDDDCAREEIPDVCGMIGAAAVEPARTLLQTQHDDVYINVAAIGCLEKIAARHPGAKARCVEILVEYLQDYRSNDSEVNAFIVDALAELEAALEHIDLIAAAFKADCVDESLRGDFEDLQIDLGLLQERITPARNYLFEKYPHLENFAEAFSALDRAFDEPDKKSPPPQPKMPHPSTSTAKAKVGRNDPCPCGSGKKYKKCCLLSEDD